MRAAEKVCLLVGDLCDSLRSLPVSLLRQTPPYGNMAAAVVPASTLAASAGCTLQLATAIYTQTHMHMQMRVVHTQACALTHLRLSQSTKMTSA